MDLNTALVKYLMDKTALDELKKEVDEQNSGIKREMEKQNITEYTVDGITAKYIVAKKESFNEAKLLQVLKEHDCTDVIKTKEYVDMDALENALYHNEISTDVIMEMDKCKETKETIQLRVTKKGGKKNG